MLNKSLFFNHINQEWYLKNIPTGYIWRNLYAYGISDLKFCENMVFEGAAVSCAYPAIPIMYYVIREYKTDFYMSMREIAIKNVSQYTRLKETFVARIEEIMKSTRISEDMLIGAAVLTYLMLRSSLVEKELSSELSFIGLSWTGLSGMYFPREELEKFNKICRPIVFSDLGALNFMHRWELKHDDLMILNLESSHIPDELLEEMFAHFAREDAHVIMKLNRFQEQKKISEMFKYHEYLTDGSFFFKDGAFTNFISNESFIHYPRRKYESTSVPIHSSVRSTTDPRPRDYRQYEHANFCY